MTVQTSPFFGINYGWSLGDGGWGDPMNSNLKLLSFLDKGAVDDFVSSLPTSPVNGYSVVLLTDNLIYVYLDSAWVFINPQVGQELFKVSDSTRWRWNGTVWIEALSKNMLSSTSPSKGASIIGNSIQLVDTINGLKNLLKTSISKYAYVSGYYSAGDGGGGNYYLDSSDTTSSDNGGSVIVATDGGRWKLNHDGKLSAKQFGAKGDGSTDDTVAISAALAALNTTKGGELYFPPGIYMTSGVTWHIQTLSLTGKRISLVGAGPALSVIRATGSIASNQAVMSLVADYSVAANSLVAGVQFSNLGFENPNNIGFGFRLEDTAYAYFENCYFKGGQFAFYGVSILSSLFANCKFSDAAETGFRVQQGTGFSGPNALTLSQCVIGNNKQWGIYADNPGGIRMFGGSVEGNGVSNGTLGGGVVLDHSQNSTGAPIAGAFYGVYFEFNNGRADIYLVHNNTTDNIALDIADCSFACGGTNSTVNDRVAINHLSSTALIANIHGCTFQELAGFSPTTSQKYINVYGSGTGVRKVSTFGNYYNNSNSYPDTTQVKSLIRSTESRLFTFKDVTNSSGMKTFIFDTLVANPKVSICVVDNTGNVFAHKVVGVSTSSVTISVVQQSISGGAWTAAVGVTVNVTVIGYSA